MKWGSVLAATVVVAFIVLYEWPKLQPNQKRERAAFVTVTAIGWLLAVLLIFFPDMPNPTDLVDAIYKPFSKLLEK
ncbi:hypothetical protein [Effusibacillus pohliae]|uniref:hypothetical protein n=1 Tax=Effusibacillus pohliae TaxID=232270 RepID=UPI00035EC172|nr:hypothetical protein [Effusibacillus pohliae]